MKIKQWQIGEVTITRIVESTAKIPLGNLLPAASAAAIDKHRYWLEPYFIDDEDQFELTIQAFILDVGELRVIVDTCLGEHQGPVALMFEKTHSGFLETMGRAGYETDQITHVLCTHLHLDHVGWNTMKRNGQWVATFANARYLFAKTEYEYWVTKAAESHTENFNTAISPIVEAGLADLVPCNYRLGDCIQFLPTPGHSPGHVSILIRSKGRQALITGDATHHPIQWAEPDWPMVADEDSCRAADSRYELIDAFADSDTLIIGTHYPSPTVGTLKKRGALVVFVAEA